MKRSLQVTLQAPGSWGSGPGCFLLGCLMEEIKRAVRRRPKVVCSGPAKPNELLYSPRKGSSKSKCQRHPGVRHAPCCPAKLTWRVGVLCKAFNPLPRDGWETSMAGEFQAPKSGMAL